MINTMLLGIAVLGLLTLIVQNLYLMHLIRTELPKYRSQVVVVQQHQDVMATLPALALQGGAVRFTLPSGSSTVTDMDGDSPFQNLRQPYMVAVFQNITREEYQELCGRGHDAIRG